ncbi:MAG: DUF255 domain-containing protein [Dysgonamonadaceae bacterium]|jgi:thioredoxin-related protein|nr:DUF255 domain-containing protein [Dysgonamonadaceae bacterium]
MKFQLMFILFFTGLFTLTLHAQETNEGIVFHENEPWADMLQLAKAENKLIFMDCYTVWCGPCKGLAKEVFPQKEVGDFFNAHFINTKYDMEKGDGKVLHEKYKPDIIGFPTLLLIDADGAIVHRMAGYKQAGELLASVKAALDGKSFYAVRDKYESGVRDFETIADYAFVLKNAYLTQHLDSVLDAYLQTIDLPDLFRPEVWETIGKRIKDPYTEPYRFVIGNLDKVQYRAKANRYEVEQTLGRGMSQAVNQIIKVSTTSLTTDSIQWVKDKTDYLLDNILSKGNVKQFTDYTAKLQLNALRLNHKASEIAETLKYIRPVGVLRSDRPFVADLYHFVITNVSDNNMIETALNEVLALQATYKSASPLDANFYDAIADGYVKLGRKAEADAARAEFAKREAARKAHVDNFLKKSNKDDNADTIAGNGIE